jgi:hypothetical protein
VIGRLAPVCLVLVACTSNQPTPAPGDPTQGALITFSTSNGDRTTSDVEIADTEDERAQGLMGRTELAGDAGMLFVYDAPTSGSYWMKDTLIPLSIAFIGEDGTVNTIRAMTPCTTDTCRTYAPREPYVYAMEMNAGWFERNGIEVGDPVAVEFLRS